MEESSTTSSSSSSSARMKKLLLLMNCALVALGGVGGPLLARLYFLHGGERIWFSSWLQCAAWPLLLLPLSISYISRRRAPASAANKQPSSPPSASVHSFFTMNHRVLAGSVGIGLISGPTSYCYAYGVERLPVSTSSLIIGSQLIFTAVSAFLLVKHRFTPYSVNAVVLLTAGAVVLAVRSSGDRPAGESSKAYYLGLLVTLVAAALSGGLLSVIELLYQKAKQQVTYGLVMEIQMVAGLTATAVCTVGMLINGDFQVIGREAGEYELGEAKYYVVMVCTAVLWVCASTGAIGVVFCSSSLFSGILGALLLPVTEASAAVFFHESFQAEKGIALGLSIWGFISYFYGDFKQTHTKPPPTTTTTTPSETELPQTGIV